MRRSKLLIASVVLLLMLALPMTALASKRLYAAKLSSANEVHEVVGSNAFGAFQLSTLADGSGYQFRLRVDGLSGQPTGAHLHGPATTSETGPIIVTLCGNPSPSATGAPCSFDSSTGSMVIQGQVPGTLLQGVTAAQFQDYLEAGLVYVNVHTALNPAGEARGQVYRANP